MVCPCQNKSDEKAKAYSDCCEPLHLGLIKTVTAEQLMRSRYSAFYLGLGQYIYNTHYPGFRGNANVEDYQASAENTTWCRLEILNSQTTGNAGIVEFKAYFIEKDKLHCLHEISNFVLDNEQWFYTDGNYQPKKVEKIYRNDPCPCQSGLKAKKCHLA